jgi:hypothetical protein
MRALNTRSLEIEPFIAAQNGNGYAILSHTWGKDSDEVTFEDMKAGMPKDKVGYEKLERSCAIARKLGYFHIWIDTCCIDKSSSAELSESINSMFRYYLESSVCLVYLEDVDDQKHGFGSSRWFTRGWTLQELIGPKNLVFLSKSWNQIGSKLELAGEISSITNIGEQVLIEQHGYSRVSVAARMSWASKRQTTREEDMAYSLLGIFNANMPLLYGEGKSAFRRLQEEIMKTSTDHSLFAWDASEDGFGGPLALHPRDFMHSRDVVPIADSPYTYSMTNQGLQIKLPMIHHKKNGYEHIAVLSCHRKNNFAKRIGITLIAASRRPDERLFRRGPAHNHPSHGIFDIDEKEARRAKVRGIYINADTSKNADMSGSVSRNAWVRTSTPGDHFIIDRYLAPPDLAWDISTRTMPLPHTATRLRINPFNHQAGLLLRCPNQRFCDFLVIFGLSGRWTALVSLIALPNEQEEREGIIQSCQPTSSHNGPLCGHVRVASVKLSGSWRLTARISWQVIMAQEVLILDLDVSDTSVRGRCSKVLKSLFTPIILFIRETQSSLLIAPFVAIARVPLYWFSWQLLLHLKNWSLWETNQTDLLIRSRWQYLDGALFLINFFAFLFFGIPTIFHMMISYLVNGKGKVQALRKPMQKLDQIIMCISIIYLLVLWLAYVSVDPASTSKINPRHGQTQISEDSLAMSYSTDFKTHIKELGDVRYLNGSDWISSSAFWSFDEFYAATFANDAGRFITAAQNIDTDIANPHTVNYYSYHQSMSLQPSLTRSAQTSHKRSYDSSVMLLLFCKRELGYKHLAVDCIEELVEGWWGSQN